MARAVVECVAVFFVTFALGFGATVIPVYIRTRQKRKQLRELAQRVVRLAAANEASDVVPGASFRYGSKLDKMFNPSK